MPQTHQNTSSAVRSNPNRTDPYLSRSVTDAQARSLISPLQRPDSFDEWRILVGDVIHSFRSRSDRRVSEEQIDGWAERGWIGHESYAPRWDHSSSRQSWRAKRLGGIRRAKSDERARAIYAHFQRRKLTYVALGLTFGVSAATVCRAILAGRKRARRRMGISRACTFEALEPYSPIARVALKPQARSNNRLVQRLATAEGGQQ